MAAAAGDEPGTVEVTLRAVGPSRPTTLRLPPHLSVADLRRSVAHDRPLPEDRLRLVLRGTTLPWRDDAHVSLRDGDSLIVAVAPKPPAKHLRDDDNEEEEEELKFKIPQTITWWKRRIFIFLRDKLRLPGNVHDGPLFYAEMVVWMINVACISLLTDILLMALFLVTMKAWIIVTIWFLLAPIAQKYDVGPLYILATGYLRTATAPRPHPRRPCSSTHSRLRVPPPSNTARSCLATTTTARPAPYSRRPPPPRHHRPRPVTASTPSSGD